MECDDYFIIEFILDQKKLYEKPMFKLMWLGFPDATWERGENIAKFITDYYEEDSNLGKKLSNPKIIMMTNAWINFFFKS